MNNNEIRLRLAGHGIKLWQLADALGVSEATVTRMFRKPIDGEALNRVIAAIEKLEQEGKDDG